MSWTRKKENCISQSIAKVEYVAVAVNYSSIIWIKKLLKDMQEGITDLVVICCDNTSAINISKNHVMYTETKHFPIKYHYLRELVQDKEVKLETPKKQLQTYSLNPYLKMLTNILEVN